MSTAFCLISFFYMYSPFPIPYSLLSIPYSLFPPPSTAYCLLPTASTTADITLKTVISAPILIFLFGILIKFAELFDYFSNSFNFFIVLKNIKALYFRKVFKKQILSIYAFFFFFILYQISWHFLAKSVL